MGRFSRVSVPSLVVLGCLEVGEKFTVGGWGGWWVVVVVVVTIAKTMLP